MNPSRDLHDQLELYVAGGLDIDELDEFVTHLDTCTVCAERLPRLMEAAAGLIPNSPAPHHIWESISLSIQSR
ncbi:MAG: zf-HC2 domain-containing protein [Acidimicrobiia bacterium]